MIWWLRALSLLLSAILLLKKYIFTDLAPKSIQTRNCVGNVVWRIFRSGQRGESTWRHSFIISVGNICQEKLFIIRCWKYLSEKNCDKSKSLYFFYRLNSLGQRTDGSSTRPLDMSTLKAKIMVRRLDLRATKVFHYYHQSPGNIIIYNAGPADEGLYQCVASNSEGVVFSRVSKVTIGQQRKN